MKFLIPVFEKNELLLKIEKVQQEMKEIKVH